MRCYQIKRDEEQRRCVMNRTSAITRKLLAGDRIADDYGKEERVNHPASLTWLAVILAEMA